MRRANRKLALRLETLRRLSEVELSRVAGATDILNSYASGVCQSRGDCSGFATAYCWHGGGGGGNFEPISR